MHVVRVFCLGHAAGEGSRDRPFLQVVSKAARVQLQLQGQLFCCVAFVFRVDMEMGKLIILPTVITRVVVVDMGEIRGPYSTKPMQVPLKIIVSHEAHRAA